MKLLGFSTIFLGLLLIALSLPLAYGKIPMNYFYGVRIPAAFKSEHHWYEINAYGGRMFASWCILIVLCGVVGLILPADAFNVYRWITLGVTVLSLIAPLVQVLCFAATIK